MLSRSFVLYYFGSYVKQEPLSINSTV
uniref:Uncharacterized protein n=1 Tax=Rhizophora mucronata TaxID=61149 RepID=A0A2P2NLG4_RHIMU